MGGGRGKVEEREGRERMKGREEREVKREEADSHVHNEGMKNGRMDFRLSMCCTSQPNHP